MARDRNKPTQSWMERAKIEIEHEEELTIERAYKLGKIRGKKETIEKACEYLKNIKSWDYYDDQECDLMSETDIDDFRKAMEKGIDTNTINTPNGVTKKELIELLKPFPDDAIVVVECCNVRKMVYNEKDNTIRID